MLLTDSCPDICASLRSLTLKDNRLPSHDDLATILNATNHADEPESSLGCWQDIQQRDCNFCQLVVSAIKESIPVSHIDPHQPIDIVLFPEEQSFRITYPSRLESRLAFVTDNPNEVAGPDNARIFGDEAVHMSQIERWLEKCNNNHDECVLKPVTYSRDTDLQSQTRYDFRESATSNFRVLDLKNQCIAHVALSVQYVTLSYVWGQSPMFRLRRDNFKHLTTPGSLPTIRDQLPKTVNDAIDLVVSLGLPYLWIDGLCLVQDDNTDVELGIKMMNSIYNGSYFTIVAASGMDATAGLYGKRNQQNVKRIGNLTMTYFHSIDWHLKRSIYNERGWTLQELVLPRRTVVFINGQVYFRCQNANWCEETWADQWNMWLDPDDSNLLRLPDPSTGFLPSFWAYQKICEDYSRRQIRYDGDAVRAIAGVTRPLASGMETLMVEGLPGYYLDHFLLFMSSNGDLRRRSQFASFSWAGWQGPVMWPRENYNWHDPDRHWGTSNIIKYLKNYSLLEYHALDRSAELESLSESHWDRESNLFTLIKEHSNSFQCDEDPQKKCFDRRWNSGSSICGDTPNWKYTWDEDGNKVVLTDQMALERGLKERRPCSVKGLDLANGQHEFDRIASRITKPVERLTLSNWMAGRHWRIRSSRPTEFGSHLAYRWSSRSTAFREKGNNQKRDERVRCALRWAKRQKELDGLEHETPDFPNYTVLQFVTISVQLTLGVAEQRPHHQPRSPFDRIPSTPLTLNSQTIGALHPDNVDTMAPAGSKVELLVISRSNSPTMGSVLKDDDDEQEQKLLWVLYVVRKDGVAERRGVGQILKSVLDQVDDPRPEIKSVLLG